MFFITSICGTIQFYGGHYEKEQRRKYHGHYKQTP